MMITIWAAALVLAGTTPAQTLPAWHETGHSGGAIGGNVFDRFTRTIDHPHATDWLRCAHDGVATAP
jgi:hypothetical protein